MNKAYNGNDGVDFSFFRNLLVFSFQMKPAPKVRHLPI